MKRLRNTISKILLISLPLFPLSAAAQSTTSPEEYFNIGLKYYEGKEVQQDYDKAFDNFYLAAKGGNADAFHLLGLMYQFGRGVNQDYKLATGCFRKGALGGNSISQYNYASALLQGLGVEKDVVEARKWLEKSAAQGWKPASFNLGMIYYKGDGVPKDYSKAYPLILEAAQGEDGLPDAMYMLATMWLEGEGCEKDVKGALELLEITATHDNWKALYTLGAGFYDGADFVGGKKDLEKSFNYLGRFYLNYKDANLGHDWQMAMGDTLRKLQFFYRFGKYVEEDTALANKLLETAAKYGDADSLEVLKKMGFVK